MSKGSTGSTQTSRQQRERQKADRPPHYKVLMHNDDYTTMEFVVEVLQSVFLKDAAAANHIMLQIHLRGIGVCGIYPFEIAETKVHKVYQLARATGYPLRCSLEPV